MRKFVILLVFIVLALPPMVIACSGCGSGHSEERTFSPVKVVTFNAGLGPGMVRYTSARTSKVAEALGHTEFDVLCLQEMWTEDAERSALDVLGLPEENTYVFSTVGTGETGRDRCEGSQLQPVLDCVERECAESSSEDTTLCALDRCQFDLFVLYGQSPECVTCLAASAGKDALGIWDTCVNGGGASRVQGGRNGIILASKWPLTNRYALPLNASGGNRVALFATVERPDGAWFDIVCTHLSAGQQIPPMHSGYATWDAEKTAQLVEIDRVLDERAGGYPSLFAGDMNFGGARGTNIASAESAWQKALDLGYRSPVHDADPQICTICADNTFRSPDSSEKVIDHVLYLMRDKDTVRPGKVTRILDAPVTITDGDGMRVWTSLSDHFGVSVVYDIADPR